MNTAPHLDPRVQDIGKAALAEMSELSLSLVYASLLTDDGFQIVNLQGSTTDGNRLASMASSIQALSEAVARELRIGTSEYVIMSAEHGHIVQLRVTGYPIVLAGLFDDRETLGKSLSVARRASAHMAELLDEAPAQNLAPQVVN